MQETRHEGPHSAWFYIYQMSVSGTSTEQKKLAAISGWRNEEVSFGSDENVLDKEGCPTLKKVGILSCALQKSRFCISQLFSNDDVTYKKEGILSLGSWGCNSI